MGKKSANASKTSVENVTEPTPATATTTTTPPEEVAAVVVEKPRKKRSKKVVVVEEKISNETTVPETALNDEVVVVATEPEPEVATNDEVVLDSEVNEEEISPASTTEKKKRRVITKETFLKASEELQVELLPLLEDNKKLGKMFKVFLSDAYRLLKIKTHQKKQKDASNSGFMRPVKPSATLEKFLAHVGEDTTKPLTRAHLTTVICKYIKDKDLQNPKDRRIIFPDDEFKKLFQVTENDTEPLTYYNIQKRIQTHVSRIEDVSA